MSKYVVSTGGSEPATCEAKAPTSVRRGREFTERMVSAVGNCGLGVNQVTDGAGALYSITGEGVTNSIGGAGVA